MFAISAWKALGPDGFQDGFYHANWHLVADEFYDFTKNVCNDPTKLSRVNSRNMSYKVITKIIVNRLKPYMSDLVSAYQTGFIPTRSIHENIVVAQKLLHSINKMKGKNGFFVVKNDLAKACDQIRWRFIAEVLDEIGVPANIRNNIMHAISSVKTNVMWNGSRLDSFCSSTRNTTRGSYLTLFVCFMYGQIDTSNRWASGEWCVDSYKSQKKWP